MDSKPKKKKKSLLVRLVEKEMKKIILIIILQRRGKRNKQNPILSVILPSPFLPMIKRNNRKKKSLQK